MSTVIPKWTAHEVEGWETLLITRSDGSRELSWSTAMILNYMPIIGIPNLTSENAIDAYCRIGLLEMTYGSFLFWEDSVGRRQPFFVTRDDVLFHIGLSTEGTSLTFEEFYESVCRGVSKVDIRETATFIANGCKTALELSKSCQK